MPQKHLFSECISTIIFDIVCRTSNISPFVFSRGHQGKTFLFILLHVFSVAFNVWIKLTFEKARKCLLIPFAKG